MASPLSKINGGMLFFLIIIPAAKTQTNTNSFKISYVTDSKSIWVLTRETNIFGIASMGKSYFQIPATSGLQLTFGLTFGTLSAHKLDTQFHFVLFF